MNVTKLEEQLGIRFKNHELIQQAFTHSSYVNEHQKEKILDNERLEFLGDAVLELGISEYLYKNNVDMAEGEMTKLRASIVCEPSLANFARDLNFNEFIMLGKGEEHTGGRDRASLLADVFESFLGALYIEQGFNAVLTFFERFIYPKIDMGAFSHAMDYKSQLQELIQQDKNRGVEYKIAQEKGPSHMKEFVVQVLIENRTAGTGIGRTKKEAEQRAAKHAIDELSK